MSSETLSINVVFHIIFCCIHYISRFFFGVLCCMDSVALSVLKSAHVCTTCIMFFARVHYNDDYMHHRLHASI